MIYVPSTIVLFRQPFKYEINKIEFDTNLREIKVEVTVFCYYSKTSYQILKNVPSIILRDNRDHSADYDHQMSLTNS